jgi:hypothetical protein
LQGDIHKKCIQNFDKEIYWKYTLKRPKKRWEGDVEIDVRKLTSEDRRWMGQAQDRGMW